MAGDSDRLSLTETAQAVIVLRYMGKADAAAGLVRSLREHLVDGAEGLHLEYPSNGFVGSDRKIAVHTLLMEALSAPGNTDEKEQEGLCRWLLSQKRLQAWGTTTSSMDAVYALMQGQKRDLVLRSNDVVRLESPKGEELAVLKSSESKLAGLGTVTATVEGRELSKGAGLLKVERWKTVRPLGVRCMRNTVCRCPRSAVPLRVFASAKKWTMNILGWVTA